MRMCPERDSPGAIKNVVLPLEGEGWRHINFQGSKENLDRSSFPIAFS